MFATVAFIGGAIFYLSSPFGVRAIIEIIVTTRAFSRIHTPNNFNGRRYIAFTSVRCKAPFPSTNGGIFGIFLA